MSGCPRCEKKQLRVEHKGYENNQLVWTIYYCHSCSFSWRDTEPETTIVHKKRDSFFRVETDRKEKYPIVLPPGLI